MVTEMNGSTQKPQKTQKPNPYKDFEFVTRKFQVPHGKLRTATFAVLQTTPDAKFIPVAVAAQSEHDDLNHKIARAVAAGRLSCKHPVSKNVFLVNVGENHFRKAPSGASFVDAKAVVETLLASNARGVGPIHYIADYLK